MNDDAKQSTIHPVHVVGQASTAVAPDHNPALAAGQSAASDNVAGKGRIDVPGQVPNLVWQNRAAAPTDFENALADALEATFEAGAQTDEQVVAGLNASALQAPGGQAWTVESFTATLRRLGS